ncbi:7532_t:CDS:2 [Paraglomus occultum]|uniref:7532_t:CDS:1 n=1 Tax=Paraglomus occultum TaxID=144539 RepID=A0A9N8ZRB9_9GLOM|nr:7532_t:CDS:2 [Paraglomus occultum]
MVPDGDQSKCAIVGRDLFHTQVEDFPRLPSTAAQPKNWKEFQEVDDPVILNYHPYMASGLPITLCEPIFADFQIGFRDCQVDKCDVDFAIELSCKMSYTFPDEDARKMAFCLLLSQYLKETFISYAFEKVSKAGKEVKPELGMGHACAYIQSSAYYIEFIRKFKQEASPVIKSRLPVFLLSLVGDSWCCLLEKAICEPLIPVGSQMASCVPRLEYIERFSDKRRVWLAEMHDEQGIKQTVIVKFVCKYSENAHRRCAELKIAPALESVVDIGYGWKIVIMEFLEGFVFLDKLAAGEIAMTQQAVLTAMNTLHKNGLVHGAVNILWRSGEVRFVDFDWADGEARYPGNMNPGINWANGVGLHKLIRIEHDQHLVKSIYKNVECTQKKLSEWHPDY